ncbi:MAG: hypothetical protein KA100_00680 [Rickettsiales bacterium]|nr:hypothetical protein [Rickettsiales bacterium]
MKRRDRDREREYHKSSTITEDREISNRLEALKRKRKFSEEWHALTSDPEIPEEAREFNTAVLVKRAYYDIGAVKMYERVNAYIEEGSAQGLDVEESESYKRRLEGEIEEEIKKAKAAESELHKDLEEAVLNKLKQHAEFAKKSGPILPPPPAFREDELLETPFSQDELSESSPAKIKYKPQASPSPTTATATASKILAEKSDFREK